MTVQEFRAKREQVKKGARKRTLVLFLIFLSMPMVSLLAVSWVERQDSAVDALRVGLTILAMLVVVGGGYGYVFATGARRRAERDGMVCAGCKSLFAFSQWVLATGNCCTCGTRLVELEPLKKVGAFLRENVLLRWRKKKRQENRYGFPIVALFVLSLFGAAAYVLFRSSRREWEKVDGFALGALTIIGLVPMFVGLFNERRLEKELGLRCPHCKKTFGDPNRFQVVVASGNCGFCGDVILGDGPKSRGQINRGEFMARRQRFERQTKWANFCMFGVLGRDAW
jgi:hypothetical protein